jgi:hypothetical protein
MPTITTTTLTLPTAWAGYLFYGDVSNLAPGEHGTIYNVLLKNDLRYVMPLTMEEVGFVHSHDASFWGVKSADCGEYVFPAPRYG